MNQTPRDGWTTPEADESEPAPITVMLSSRLMVLANLLKRGAILRYKRLTGLSSVEFGLVASLGRRPPMSVARLAEAVGQDKGQISRALANLNPMGSEYRKLSRFYQGNSFEIPLDGSGRVTVPAPLLAHAGIAKEVVVVGVGDHLEVWSAERWRTQQEALDAEIGEVTERLGNPS